MIKTYLGFGLLLGIFLLSGCGGEAGGGKWDAPAATNKLLVSLTLTPAAASIPIDGIQQFTATATYDDGSTGNVTASSSWSSATLAVATISVSGFATGVTAGTSQITATFGGLTSAAVTLTVTPATLTSLVVTPPLASVTVGGTRQYVALATYSDSSTSIVTSAPTTVWTSATPAVATISASGLASGVSAGTSEITATFGGQTSIAVTLTVDPGLALTIVPGAVCSVASGPTIPTVTMSDPTSGNVLATTSTAGVANNGKLITATFNMAMDPATIASATAPFTFTIVETISGNNVPGTVTLDATNKIATFTTDAALLADTGYTAAITTDAMSAAVPSVGIACPYEWDFKTVNPPATGVGPINLGLAESFGIASRAGLTSTGVTVVNGDVVLAPLATCADATGGPGGASQTCLVQPAYATTTGMTVNGIIYWAGDTIDNGLTANTVTTDLENAWIEGMAKVNTQPPIAADEMGGKTFIPGVYENANLKLSAGMVATLDAGNDANAIFIFKVTLGGDFVDSGTLLLPTRIDLINGAQARNVWFVIGRDATIGSGTIWNGNILANRTVTVLNGSTVTGRVLGGAGGAGAISLTGAASPSVTTINVPL